MPTGTKNNLFEGLPVELISTQARFQKAHADLKKLLAEHSEHISGRRLDTFLDTLKTLKDGASEEN
jgi:hypothetical protein